MTSDGTREFSTMPRRKGLKVPLAPDERMLVSSPGSWREHVRSGWRMGTLHLTSSRIVFSIQTGVLWELSLSDIDGVALERQKYVGGQMKDVIVVTYQRTPSKKVGIAILIMKDFEAFKKELFQQLPPQLDEDTIEAVVEGLNPRGQAIVQYLLENGHATSSELAHAVGAPGYMEVLLEIRDRINPAAEGIIDGPLLVARRAKVDASTGEKGLSRWGLVTREEEEGSGQPLVDIFDEGDHVDVLMELVGVREEDILLGVSEQGVVVSAHGEDGAYREEVLLPPGVSTQRVRKTYSNDMLVISLQKVEP